MRTKEKTILTDITIIIIFGLNIILKNKYLLYLTKTLRLLMWFFGILCIWSILAYLFSKNKKFKKKMKNDLENIYNIKEGWNNDLYEIISIILISFVLWLNGFLYTALLNIILHIIQNHIKKLLTKKRKYVRTKQKKTSKNNNK